MRKESDARSPVWLTCKRNKKERKKKKRDAPLLSRRREGEGGRYGTYFVYVGLFFCKVKFAETLILDFLEEIVAKKFVDEGVFEGFARSVRGGQSIDIIRVE